MKIIVVDDHEIVREGLLAAFRADPRYQIVGGAGTGAAARSLVRQMRPDVALVDLRLPDVSGEVLCRALLQDHPELLVVMLTTYLSEGTVRDALRAGAAGYVTKAAGLTALRDTIDGLGRNGPRPQHAAQIVRQLDQADTARAALPRPTPQQACVLELAAQGLTNREVGEQMFISESTVRFHLQKLKGLMNARTRTELIAKAIRMGAIPAAPEDLPLNP